MLNPKLLYLGEKGGSNNPHKPAMAEGPFHRSAAYLPPRSRARWGGCRAAARRRLIAAARGKALVAFMSNESSMAWTR